jgi:hypothetical protein
MMRNVCIAHRLRRREPVFGGGEVGNVAQDLAGGQVGLGGALAEQVVQGPGPDVDCLGDLGLGPLILVLLDILPGGLHLRQGEIPRFGRFRIHRIMELSKAKQHSQVDPQAIDVGLVEVA